MSHGQTIATNIEYESQEGAILAHNSYDSSNWQEACCAEQSTY